MTGEAKKRPQLTLSQYLEQLNSSLGHRFVAHYKKNTSCHLSTLCETYGSDKGAISSAGHPYPWPAHTYADYYSRLFDHCRLHVRRVFECGLGTNNPVLVSSMGINGKPGASLRVWQDYFPNAMIVGADIDRDILFQEDRIKTYHVDQTDPHSIDNLWNEVGVDDFDFMIDDGLHTYKAGICLFEHSISKLAQNGIYIIEDVSPRNTLMFRDYFNDKNYQVDFVNLMRPRVGLGDNNLIVIRKT
jgi:hypothetical protein